MNGLKAHHTKTACAEKAMNRMAGLPQENARISFSGGTDEEDFWTFDGSRSSCFRRG
jgi:hypothetical protein